MPRAKQPQPSMGGSLSSSQGALQQTLGRQAEVSQNRMLEAMQKRGETEAQGYASFGQSIQRGVEKGVDIAQEDEAMELQRWNAMEERLLRRDIAADEMEFAKKTSREALKREDKYEETRIAEREQDLITAKHHEADRRMDIYNSNLINLQLVRAVLDYSATTEQQEAGRQRTATEALLDQAEAGEIYDKPKRGIKAKYKNAGEPLSLNMWKDGATPGMDKWNDSLGVWGLNDELVGGGRQLSKEFEEVLQGPNSLDAVMHIKHGGEQAIEDLKILLEDAKAASEEGKGTKEIIARRRTYAEQKLTGKGPLTAEEAQKRAQEGEEDPWYERFAGWQSFGTGYPFVKKFTVDVSDTEADTQVRRIRETIARIQDDVDSLEDAEVRMSKLPLHGSLGAKGISGQVGGMVRAMLDEDHGVSKAAISRRLLNETINEGDSEEHRALIDKFIREELTREMTSSDPEIDKLLKEKMLINRRRNRMLKVYGRNDAFKLAAEEQRYRPDDPYRMAAGGKQ